MDSEDLNEEMPYRNSNRMCELRIVLLGKNVLENNRVGNFILGRAAFETESPPVSVHHHSERVRGQVEGRPITVINTPDLFHPRLSQHQLSVAVEECVSLSDPGPHVFILVLQPDNFTEGDRNRMDIIVSSFSDEGYNYTMVLTTDEQEPGSSVDPENENEFVQGIISKSGDRYFEFKNHTSCSCLIEKVDKLVKETGGYLSCECYEDIPQTSEEQMYQPTVNKPESKNQMDDDSDTAPVSEKNLECCDFTVALIGTNAAVGFGKENILLGEEELYLDLSQITPRTREVSGRLVSVINMLGLHELPQQSTDTHISHLLRDHKIHVFLYVLPLGLLTDEDKMVLDWLHRTFGEKSLDFVMILFTYETEDQCDSVIDDLKNNSVMEQIVHKCGSRYHTCNKSLNNKSEMRTLLEKINQWVSENRGCYTDEIYSTVLKNKHQVKENYHDLKTHEKGKSSSAGVMESSDEDKTKVEKQKAGLTGERKEGDNEEDKRLEIEDLMNRLHLKEHLQHKLTTADILEIKRFSLQPKVEAELTNTFLQKLLTMDYRARYTLIRDKPTQMDQTKSSTEEVEEEDDFEALFTGKSVVDRQKRKQTPIHPMDVQMAVFHCADRFLQQFMVTKLSQCQYALPLLVPNPFTQQIEFPLWTFRQIKKSWRSTDISGKVTSKTKPVFKAETPMVFFFRFGSVSSSKSQLMNSLINERYNTFFHRHCPGSSETRLLMDGVVEIAWYCPSGKCTDIFTDCVAFCNLHGDAMKYGKQWDILAKKASVNVVLSLRPDENATIKPLIKNLYRSDIPLICLLTEDNCTLERIRAGKYRMGLKNRNQSDVSAELKRAIRECLSVSHHRFKLEELGNGTDFKVDEEEGEFKKGKETALQIMHMLKKEDLCEVKQRYLPCQGKLWHDWCQKNQELHHLTGNNIEATRSTIQATMSQLRAKQRKYGCSKLMKSFISSLESLMSTEKMHFLKWFQILLDELTSDTLSDLHHEYDEKWSVVLELKKKHDKSEQLSTEQANLEKISEKLTAAMFGLEHILREMGQIYEAWESQQRGIKKEEDMDSSNLPGLAAKLMISGHPVELMDGDAAHVPLIWVTAVLDEVIKILGDQRVFVLSVLGIQSTGKSTMLNAMFGLQFAVSAGRCTRGAFMQLVRVTEEMKEELKFDYILVVDTEGLRALKLAGRSTRHHDNELATFVVGLGNMTLINIFGENPAEMQDILQIVVQAFLRMKKVRLSPSCVFVHQNVGDITAGEKNKEGRRRLQEKLDEMTQLAAKEEVCDSECFSDVIAFDVQKDVKYFAQLWEGDPPMAPPNPSYSEHIQELKKTIQLQGSESHGVTLTHFKTRIQNLWEALLHENFVFSFKNIHEIAVYRKLEDEYGKWSWSLRSAMLNIEDKFLNRIKNKKLHEVQDEDLEKEMTETLQGVQNSMKNFFEGDKEKDILIQWREKFEGKTRDLHAELLKEAKRKMDDIGNQREARKKLDEKKTLYEGKLFEKSKELALNLKHKANDENELKKEFDSMWITWVLELTKDTPLIKDIDISKDVTKFLTDISDWTHIEEGKRSENYKIIQTVSDYSDYVTLTKMQKVQFWKTSALTSEDQHSIRQFIIKITQLTDDLVTTKPVAEMGYSSSYIQDIIHTVKNHVKQHNSKSTKYRFKNEFLVDLSLFVCERAVNKLAELYMIFREANDPLIYLEKKKPEYYNVFKKYCQGATSTAVFGSLICSGLREPVLQSVYNKTATDLAGEMRTNVPAFNGNRSNLEKHILKSLAEKEKFGKFVQYIDSPREHFGYFIRDRVKQYMTADNPKALTMIKGHIKHKKQCIITAAQTATAQVKQKKGDANMWLTSFSDSLTDELEYSKDHLSGQNCQDITDFDLLEEVVRRELNTVTEELNSSFTSLSDLKMEMFRERPDEILIKHFCLCCWEQCPFCKAVCTNTIEGHTGDHSVPFHRSPAVKGVPFRGTNNFSHAFCTTKVTSDGCFYPHDSEDAVPYREYKSAGPPYSDWSITPDLSELPYWKWFVCRFQTDLETLYTLKFQGPGEIPDEWRKYTKEDAIASLDKYI